jgi:hypothetical protein
VHGARAHRGGRHRGDERRDDQREHEGDAFPVGREAEHGDQRPLVVLRVREHPLVPRVLHRFPVEAPQLQPVGRSEHRRAAGFGGARERAGGIDADRRDDRGRIDARPAAAAKPDLGPRVRIRLPHRDEAVHRIEFTALVAGDHARGQAERAHQHDERRGEVLAVAAPGVEQELVDRMPSEPRRRQRVRVAAAAEVVECGRDQVRVAVGGARRHLLQQRGRERLGPRVVGLRQLEPVLQFGGVRFAAQAKREERPHRIASPFPHQIGREQFHL